MPKSNKSSWLCLAWLCCLAFYSCKIAMPKVDLVSFNLNPSAAQVELRAENPNGFTVTATQIALQAFYQQKSMGKLSNDKAIRFPARQSVVFPLKADLNTAAMLQAAPNALMLVLQGKKLPLQVQGEIKVKVWGMFRASVPVDTTLMVDPKELIGR
jgi:LEA14-like dessication related protein